MYNLVPVYGIPSEPLPLEVAILCNPHYGESYGYTHNCQRCVWVYELRRRGYNVIARPKNRRSARGDPVDELHEIRSVVVGGEWVRIPSEDSLSFIYGTIRAVGASRWIIHGKNKKTGKGHVFVIELLQPYKIGSGAILWIEPQQNTQKTSEYLNEFRSKGLRMMRIDDKEFTYLIKWVGEIDDSFYSGSLPGSNSGIGDSSTPQRE